MITVYVDDPARIALHIQAADSETEPVVLRSLGPVPALEQPAHAARSASAPCQVGLLTALALVAAAGVCGYVVAPRGRAEAPTDLAATQRAALAPLSAPGPPLAVPASLQHELALRRALASRPTVIPPPSPPAAPAPANPFGLHP